MIDRAALALRDFLAKEAAGGIVLIASAALALIVANSFYADAYFGALQAARRGEAEIAFGNVVGSNIYNILGIGGVTMIVSPAAISGTLFPVDLAVMAATAIAVLIVSLVWKRFGRAAGIVLMIGYAAYVAMLLAAPAMHENTSVAATSQSPQMASIASP